MKLTEEQEKILVTNCNIKINAIAGSGKTTTMVEYAKSRPKASRILYVAFNKSVKQEAELKFAQAGLQNVSIETAHSLAYKQVVYKSRYKIKASYQSYELLHPLNINLGLHPNEMYILCNHVLKFAAYFCNSTFSKLAELNYLDVVHDELAYNFVQQYYEPIHQYTREFLAKMHNGTMEITHDFYLKLFQLQKPKLPFDYILFDEGQDASPAMLDVFLQQENAIKVMVGDTHQQIYSWRYAINSLSKVDYENFYLSNSFRYNSATAHLATLVLDYKKIYSAATTPKITGLGEFNSIKSRATLARTNLGLLKKAIDYMSENNNKSSIYFEGNFNSYTYADEGASLYDILNLFNGKRDRIKNGLIKSMNSIAQLEEYIEKTDDKQLGMMLELVLDYENEIFEIIKNIKEQHTDSKQDAKMVFSTVHKCKGMEYDEVTLAEDFITEEKIEKLKNAEEKESNWAKKLDEEINLIYVAITRAKRQLNIPRTLLPITFEEMTIANKDIVILENIFEPMDYNKNSGSLKNSNNTKNKNTSFGQIDDSSFNKFIAGINRKNSTLGKNLPEKKGMPWSSTLDKELSDLYQDGWSVEKLAQHFKRSNGAISSRLRRLDLDEF
jgi:F-box protein, helicase, 18